MSAINKMTSYMPLSRLLSKTTATLFMLILSTGLLKAQTPSISMVTGSPCPSTMTQFTVMGSCSSWSWSVSSGGSVVAGQSGQTATILFSATGSYTISCSAYCGGTTQSLTRSQFIYAPTTASASLSLSQSTPVCQGSSITLTAAHSNGGNPTYKYYVHNGTTATQIGSTTPNSTQTFDSNGWPAGSYTAYVTMVTTQSCASPSSVNSLSIPFSIIIPSPPVAIQVNKLNFCSGEGLNVTANVTAANYSWKINGTQFSTMASAWITVSTNAAEPNTFNPGETITLDVTGVSANCLPTTGYATTSGMSFTIAPTVTPTVYLNNPGNVCNPATVILTTTSTYGGTSPTYEFFLDGAPVQNGASGSYNAGTMSPGNHSAYVKLTSNADCRTATVITSVLQNFVVANKANYSVSISGPLAICNGQPSGTFSSTVTNGIGGLTYAWLINDDEYGNANSTWNNPLVLQGDKIQLKVTSDHWCVNSPITSSPYFVTISPTATPTASISVSPTTYCDTDPITFNATSNVTLSGAHYEWKVNNTTIGGDNQSIIVPASATSAAGKYSPGSTITLSITGISGTCVIGTSASDNDNSPALTINSLPAQPSVPILSYACDLTTLTRGTSPYDANWYWQGTVSDGKSTGSNAGTNTTNIAGTHYIRARHNTTGCWSVPQSVAVTIVSTPLAAASPVSDDNTACGSMTVYKPSAPIMVRFFWQGTNSSGTENNTITALSDDFEVPNAGTLYYIRPHVLNTSCWGPSTAFKISQDPAELSLSSYIPGQPLAQALHSIRLLPGFRAQASVGNTLSTRLTNAVCNNNMNWSETISYAEDGTTIIASERSYLDGAGNTLQDQAKDALSQKIFASQPLLNKYGVPVGSTLPAPIALSTFTYQRGFVTNAAGLDYTAGDFDVRTSIGTSGEVTNPKPVSPVSGTLGWYYSNKNVLEPLTPATQYPYSRSFAQEGPDPTVTTSASVGDAYKMGAGHEVKNERFVTPSSNTDIAKYYQWYQDIVAAPLTHGVNLLGDLPLTTSSFSQRGPTSIVGGAGYVTATSGSIYSGALIGSIITVVPGKTYVFAVKGYKNLSTSYCYLFVTNSADVSPHIVWPGMTFGVGSSAEKWISNRFTVPAGVTGIKVGMLFESPQNSANNFTITGFDLREEIPSNAGYNYVTTGPDGIKSVEYVDADGRSIMSATIPAGSSTPDFWSYNYYNAAGALVASIPPKGVGATPTMITYYKYDHLGRSIEVTSPDERTSQFVYTIDGKIRFSQNQVQRDATPKRFSYTNYDYLGRLIESGEYTQNGTNPYVFEPHSTTSPGVYSVLQPAILNNTGFSGTANNLQADRTSEVSKIFYDAAQGDFTGDGMHPVQTFMIGQVAKTSNANTTTWYSYDESGNLKWTKQNIVGLGDKYIDYTYDYYGNVTEVAYQKVSGSTDELHHHYVYDINNRLTQVSTSLVGATQTERAKYYYYLHGPLKRVELLNGAQKLQGIDYVYNIDGSLKAINSADAAMDPGNDGGSSGFIDDVFGMALDYYTGDYSGGTQAGSINASGYPDQYSGLVKAQRWHSFVDSDVNRAYAYQYDNRNQFSSANWGSASGSSGSYTFAPASPQSYKESISSYDKNGNIGGLTRNGKDDTVLGNYTYTYNAGKNQLASVTGGASPVNYTYDAVGRMIQQVEGAQTMKVSYNVMGLVKDVRDASNSLLEQYFYSDGGDLVKKLVYVAGVTKTAYYVRDVAGNPLAIYEATGVNPLKLVEQPIYGAGRIGMMKPTVGLPRYFYEVNDHLGNVRAVIGEPVADSPVATYEAENMALDQSNFLRYDKAKRVSSHLFDHTNETQGGAASVIYSNDFSLSYTGFQTHSTITLSLEGGRLKATGAVGGSHAYRYVTTIPGRNYRVTCNMDLASGSSISLHAFDVALNADIGQLTISSNGTYNYVFIARSTSTAIMFTSTSGPRNYYIDNLVIDDVSPLGTYAERLNGSANEKYGIARSLSVAPGDVVSLGVWAKYVDTNSGNWSAALTTLMGQITGGAGGVVIDGAGYSTSTSTFSFGGMVDTQGSTGGPKAYLNWLVFDRRDTLIDAGYRRLSSTPKETGQNIAHEQLTATVNITEPGYLYVYLSNEETGPPIEVYFDDFRVTHTKGKVVAGGDYYPFGLPMETRQVDRERYRFGYQGQYSEKDSLTNWNTFELRMYDARFGRWISPDPYGQFASPYVGMGNNPVSGTDADGGWVDPIKTIVINGVESVLLNEVVVTAGRTLTKVASSAVAKVASSINMEFDERSPSMTYSAYQIKYPEFSGMNEGEAMNHWSETMREGFDKQWNEAIRVEKVIRAQEKLDHFSAFFGGAMMAAGRGGFKTGSLPPVTTPSLSPRYLTLRFDLIKKLYFVQSRSESYWMQPGHGKFSIGENASIIRGGRMQWQKNNSYFFNYRTYRSGKYGLYQLGIRTDGGIYHSTFYPGK